MKARIFALQLPATALVECVWTSDSGIWTHGFIENFLNTEEHNCGKIVRSGDVAIITAGYAKMNNSEPVEVEERYEVPPETLDDITAIFARSRMNAWPKMPKKLDGPSSKDIGTKWSMSFTFDGEEGSDGTCFSFSDEQALPEITDEAVDEIRKILRVRRKVLSWRSILLPPFHTAANEE